MMTTLQKLIYDDHVIKKNMMTILQRKKSQRLGRLTEFVLSDDLQRNEDW